MDFFEGLISKLLEVDGYWVKRSYKVIVSVEDKAKLKLPNMPRPEIDILAYKPGEDVLYAIEAKSYLDSSGVNPMWVMADYKITQGRYRFFTSALYRDIVIRQLSQELIKNGMIRESTTIKLGLATGKVHKKQSSVLAAYMDEQDWLFWSPEEIKVRLGKLAAAGYENDPTSIAVKMILRD